MDGKHDVLVGLIFLVQLANVLSVTKFVDPLSQLHAGDRGFGCDKCDKKFVSQSRLTYHKTTVHDPPRCCSKLHPKIVFPHNKV